MSTNKHVVIFVTASTTFDELVDIFCKFLNPDFALRLRCAATELRAGYEQRAAETVKLELEKLSPVVAAFEPLLEEYREACADPHMLGNLIRSLVLKKLYHKLNEYYGQPSTPCEPRDDPL